MLQNLTKLPKIAVESNTQIAKNRVFEVLVLMVTNMYEFDVLFSAFPSEDTVIPPTVSSKFVFSDFGAYKHLFMQPYCFAPQYEGILESKRRQNLLVGVSNPQI